MESGARSTGAELEAQQLRHRAMRIRQAIDTMRGLANDPVPAALRHGINVFGHELERVERRLRELERAERQHGMAVPGSG